MVSCALLLGALVQLIFLPSSEALVPSKARRNGTIVRRQGALHLAGRTQKAETFAEYYATVSEGRGIWKWSNALAAYERHFGHFRGLEAIEGAEVGVQSGGSLVMWHAVLGEALKIHGVDINPSCAAFADDKTSITIGDQDSIPMWSDFFAKVAPALDFLVDDGGHLASQMLTTTEQSWPRLKAGGVLSIEDIHGGSYLEPFFKPVAAYWAGTGDVSSIHVYPYLLIAHKKGAGPAPFDPSLAPGAKVFPVATTQTALDDAIANSPPGSVLLIEDNDGFFTTMKLQYLFWRFNGLHVASSIADSPVGCTGAEVPRSSWNGCNYYTTNSQMQSRVTGVHFLQTRLLVEIAKETPVIEAVRRGTEWVRWPKDTPKGKEIQYFNNFLVNHDNAPAVHFFAPPSV